MAAVGFCFGHGVAGSMETTFNLAAAGVSGGQGGLLLVGGLLACSLLVGRFRGLRSPAGWKLV